MLRQSIDLTRISSRSNSKPTATASYDQTESKIEYSAREVSPPALLLEQLIQAHHVFLLHHAQTLAELFSRLARPKFCAILTRFWDDYVWHWDVLLHGNPAIDIFNGLKLAAGGELGIGVGEEEWGSGEREVLEGFIARTDGLVDLIVSRFGEAASTAEPPQRPSSARKSTLAPLADEWHLGHDPRPSDGVVFSGIGAIARPSVKHISNWVILLFKHGHDAYGIRENPLAVNRRHPKRDQRAATGTRSRRASLDTGQQPTPTVASEPPTVHPSDFGIPAPIVGNPTKTRTQHQRQNPQGPHEDLVGTKERTQPAAVNAESAFGTDTLIKYVTFGLYGARFSTPPTDSAKQSPDMDGVEGKKVEGTKCSGKPKEHSKRPAGGQSTSPGYFMIGLHGNLDNDYDSGEDEARLDSAPEREKAQARKATNSRIVLRSLTVERTGKASIDSMDTASTNAESAPRASYERLRVIVYVKRPFIFTFLFELQTDSLAIPSFYRSLHHQLGPLQQPLLNSTSPSKVWERVSEASAPKSTVATRSSQPISDLVYDSYNQTVHTTIPNIPEPGSPTSAQSTEEWHWTRVEALSVHSQILNTYVSTRRRPSELERTCKTSRGWWVVWMRLPHVAASQQLNRRIYREAFLTRKASDYVAPAVKVPGASWGRRAGASSGWGLADGIGIDARQYIEGLVSLNR